MDSIDELDFSKTYTYADYYSWRFEQRVELIRGKVFPMVNYPGASCMGTNHQIISLNIAGTIWEYLDKNKGIAKVFTAPFDVRLVDKSRYDEDVTNVVQPDISVFLDKANLDERGGVGSPDIVVEILIPGNNLAELKQKFQLYEDFGVAEYWIVFAEEQSLLRYTLDNKGKYTAGKILTNGDKLTTSLLPGFELTVDAAFHKVVDFRNLNDAPEDRVEKIDFI
jgi:Uma2 family endonuclease